ncbi:hypothetical protein P3C33_30415, partial [Mesorhizobium sp. P16.1]|nr:hypothetical protein [Mesorhizobium sp. P16.1]
MTGNSLAHRTTWLRSDFDGTAKGGIVIAIARRLGLPIRFIGIGEQPQDFGEFDASRRPSGLRKTSLTGNSLAHKRRPSGLRKTSLTGNSLAHRTTWL